MTATPTVERALFGIFLCCLASGMSAGGGKRISVFDRLGPGADEVNNVSGVRAHSYNISFSSGC